MKQHERQALLEDIRNRGVLEPIELHDDLILDGRHRWKASLEADLPKVPVVDATLKEDETFEQFILRRAAVGRRMLSRAQIACLAAKDYAIEVQKGKERQRKNLKQFADSPEGPFSGPSGESQNSRQRIAEILGREYGISKNYIKQAFRLIQVDMAAFELLGSGDLTMKEASEILASAKAEDIARENEKMKEEIKTLRNQAPRVITKRYGLQPKLVKAFKPYEWADAELLDSLDPTIQEMVADVILEKGTPRAEEVTRIQAGVDDAELRLIEREMEIDERETTIEELREEIADLRRSQEVSDETEDLIAAKKAELAGKEEEIIRLRKRIEEMLKNFEGFKAKIRERLDRYFDRGTGTWHFVDTAITQENKQLRERLADAKREIDREKKKVAALLDELVAFQEAFSTAGHVAMERDYYEESKAAFRGIQRLLGTLQDDAVLQVPQNIGTAKVSSDVVNLLNKTLKDLENWMDHCMTAIRTAGVKIEKR
jgi:uncharacterized membrane-anchored protein YhcB (DUF1043 family)